MKKFSIFKLVVLTISIFMLAFLFSACSKKNSDASNEALSGSIEIAGSSTVFPITSAVAELFIQMHDGVNVPVRSTGTGGGFKNFFVQGSTDINNASRPIKDSEREAAAQNGIEAIGFQVATDAITIVVNKNLAIDEVSTEELKEIWSPEFAAKKWNDVNSSWPDAEFELYGPTSASGTFDYFTDVINGEEGLSRTDYQKTEQDNTIIEAVSGSQYALGYLGLAYYLENKDRVKALRVNGVEPSIDHARNGTYTPLSRPIYIYVSSKSLAKKEVQEFMRFYIEQTNTSLISEIGYVPLTDAIKENNMKLLEESISEYSEQ